MKKLTYMLAAALVVAAFATTGCVRVPTYIEDHPNSNMTLMSEAKIGILSKMPWRVGYQYICNDEGAVLKCKAICGGDAEHDCAGSITGNFVGVGYWGRNYNGKFANGQTRSGGGAVAAAAAPVAEPAVDDMAADAGEEVTE